MKTRDGSNTSQYNPQQLQAIEHAAGPVLVLAGAGTGKTAIVTARIARLVLEKKVSPERILALTFTEKAAWEMQQRVDEMLPYGVVETQIMTFHSLAERILREYALDIGLSSDYQIITEAQQIVIMQDTVAQIKFSYYSPAHQPYQFVQALLRAVSKLKDAGIHAQEFEQKIQKAAKRLDADQLQRLGEVAECYNAYEKECKRRNFVDFGDLLLKLQQLLVKRPRVRQEVSERYEYVLVDEFQDTNQIQMNIVSLLLNKQQNLMVVGDDDQAIYKFRGASVENILHFLKQYPRAKLIVLAQNYRSGQEILDAGYQLITHNNPERLEHLEGIDKHLLAQPGVKSQVVYHAFGHKLEEQQWLAQQIEQLLESGVESTQVAILLRKNNQIKTYIQLLQKRQITYYVNQSLDLFEQPVIKTLLALCSVLASPKDSQALYHLLASQLFQVPIGELIELSAQVRSTHQNLETYLSELDPDETSVGGMVQTIRQWRELCQGASSGEVLYTILKDSGFLPELLKKATKDNLAAQEVQLVAEFFKIVKEFELSSAYQDMVSLSSFMSEIRRSEADISAEVSPLDVEGVQILTVHRAKGLEFEHVFLPDLNEQTFPTYSRAETIKLDDLLENPPGDHYQEERRLFYVALTRAKQGLYLSNAADHGGKRPKRPSRFIVEALGKGRLQNLASQANAQTNLAEFLDSFAAVPNVKPPGQLTAHLYSDGWLRLTTNQVADYLRSPQEFWLFQVLRLPKGPFHALVYGSAIHAALEHYHQAQLKGKRVTLAEVQKVFQQSWSAEGFVSLKHQEALYKKGLNTLKTYVNTHVSNQRMPIAVEKPFELHLPEQKIIITGRYDIVFAVPGGVEVRDFKTSEVTTEKAAIKKAKDSLQLGIYALAWEKLQQQPVKLTSLEFVNNNIVGENATINHEKTLKLINQVAEGIASNQFEAPGSSTLNFARLLP